MAHLGTLWDVLIVLVGGTLGSHLIIGLVALL
jgi:hypothetical protein